MPIQIGAFIPKSGLIIGSIICIIGGLGTLISGILQFLGKPAVFFGGTVADILAIIIGIATILVSGLLYKNYSDDYIKNQNIAAVVVVLSIVGIFVAGYIPFISVVGVVIAVGYGAHGEGRIIRPY